MGTSGKKVAAGATTFRSSVPVLLTLVTGIGQNVTFTWSTPFPDAAYSYDVTYAAALIGNVTISEQAKTAASVTIRFTATALVSAGLGVSVFAWE